MGERKNAFVDVLQNRMDPRSSSSPRGVCKDESSRGLNAGRPESDVDKLAASSPLDHSYAGRLLT